MSGVNCTLAGRCTGCPWIARPYEEQLGAKRGEVAAKLEAAGVRLPAAGIAMRSAGETRLRTRADLSVRRTAGEVAFGLYEAGPGRKVTDMKACPLMDERLEAWLGEFRSKLPPLIEKGSVRLRVAPDGTRGAWLDFAHEDVKRLFDERAWLSWLLEHARVEIGQRFKPLARGDGGRLRLQPTAEPGPWFETYLAQGGAGELVATPLFGAIGSFTQPGTRVNRMLIETIAEALRRTDAPRGGRALELFSGLGNFTLPLASLGFEVTAYEVDAVSIESFEHSLRTAAKAAPGLASRVKLERKNLYASGALGDVSGFELLFVDPPRSGLKEATGWLGATATPPARLLYVSCFADSLAADLGKIAQFGYELDFLAGVDQFAHSAHCEWVALLKKAR